MERLLILNKKSDSITLPDREFATVNDNLYCYTIIIEEWRNVVEGIKREKLFVREHRSEGELKLLSSVYNVALG